MRKKDDEKQQRIKDAVMQLILQEGFAGTSISKIARAAGVSPATVYIYYDSKEAMLRDIYTEYSEEVFGYLIRCTQPEMTTRELIATLMRSYYNYIQENEEVYSFVEQFSQCPALACQCGGKQEICRLFSLIDERKARGEIRNYSHESLAAVIFSPVKAVASEPRRTEEERRNELEEIIEMIERALLW